ncbi:hypothetical protein ACOME3_005053 [Neoechinorhynchus agilis]
MSQTPHEKYPLHWMVFNDTLHPESELDLSDEQIVEIINLKDNHGNTALHLAAILGRTGAVKWLLKHGAKVRTNNNLKCHALEEAISYGKRENIKLIFEEMFNQMIQKNADIRDKVKNAFITTPDIQIKLNWEFKTWIPLLSNFLPSDVCLIRKKGAKIRVDTTIPCLDSFTTYFLKKPSDISIIVDTEKPGDIQPIFVDHKKQIYVVSDDDKNKKISEEFNNNEIDGLMSNDLMTLRFVMDDAEIHDVMTGFFTKHPKILTIGGKTCQCKSLYHRQEHLSSDILENRENQIKYIEKEIASGNGDIFESQPQYPVNIPDCPPHTETGATFTQYLESEDYFSTIGRQLKRRIVETPMSLEFAAAEESDFSVKDFINIIEPFVSLKHFKRLKYFIGLIEEYGFPMRIEIPLITVLRAIVTFQEITINPEIDDEIFHIPDHYKQTYDFPLGGLVDF